MKKVTIIFFLCIFILFRPYQLQNSGMMYSGDDDSYMAHATSLVFFEFPSYEKEYFTAGKGIPLHSIGPALLASPFVFSASIIDRISGNEIISRRVPSTINKSWTAFGFFIASIFYLWLTCLLLYKGLTFYFSSEIASLAVILTVLSEGVPLFALRRPVFSHIYEIFIQSVFLFLLLRLIRHGGYVLSQKKQSDLIEAVSIGLLAGLISLVRINNVFLSLAWPVILFLFYYPRVSSIRIVKMIVISYLSMAGLIFIFMIWPILSLHNISQYVGYTNIGYVKNLLMLHDPVFYIKRLGLLLCGIDWGLIFTSPYILLGFAALMVLKKDKVCSALKYLLIPLTVNLYLTLACGEQGGWYGYRYLVFSLIPVIIYPMAYLISLSKDKNLFFYYVIILISVFPVLSMLSFESNNTNLTLEIIDQGFGVNDWGNNSYQLEIYKTIITSPIHYLAGILKGGPLYFVYLVSTFFGFKQYLPGIIYEKYTAFEPVTFIKTAAVYLFPFIMLFFYKLFTEKPKICSRGKNV